MKTPLTLSKTKTAEEPLTSSRAEQISRIWQAIAFIEEVRADLNTSRLTDPAAIALTASTQQLQIAAAILQPRAVSRAQQEHDQAQGEKRKDRREEQRA